MSVDEPETQPDHEPARPNYLELVRQETTHVVSRRTERRIAVHRMTLQHLQQARLDEDRLGYLDPQALALRHEQLERTLSAEIAAGATRHGRLSGLVRQVPRLVAVIDGVVLYTFAAVIFNAAAGDPLSTPLASLASLLLAVLASGVAYTWLALTGERIKTFRGELGEVLWRAVGRTTWLMISLSILLLLALSVLMYTRVVAEVLAAGADQLQPGVATPIGIVFAVISAIGNLAVVAVHALDGSVLADEHRRTGRALRRHEQAVLRRRLALLASISRRSGREEGQGLSA